MDDRGLFLEHIGLIEQAVRFIGRRYRLSADELEELSSSIQVKLLENDCEVLRKFQGRSSLRTYLTAVVGRHFLDMRIEKWGKWRPCAQARRMGPVAVLLDRLLNRDGYTFDEAVEVLRTNHQTPLSERELAVMSEQLPKRSGRQFVGEEELAGIAVPPSTADFLNDRQAEQARLEAALSAGIAELPPDDRLILKMRFEQGLQVAEIARLTRLEPKPLYRRIENLMSGLRGFLERRGVQSDRVKALLDEQALELVGIWGGDPGGLPPARPSIR